MTSPGGPFATEPEARRVVPPWTGPRPRRPRPALAARVRHDHLLQAVTAAGVTLGAFDAEGDAWLADTPGSRRPPQCSPA